MRRARRHYAPTLANPSSTSAYTEYLGILVRPHGVDGTMMLGDTVGLQAHLQPGSTVAVGYSREFSTVMVVDAYHQSPSQCSIRLRGVSTREDTAALLDQAVYVQAADVGVVEDDRYSIGDIEGCTAVTTNGDVVGTITDVWLMPANDVWVITCADGSTLPLPVIDNTVVSVDTSQRRVVVVIPDGLENVNRTTRDDDDA